jgi:Fe-S cluster assembly protein SufB
VSGGISAKLLEELVRVKSIDELLGVVKPYPKEIEIRGKIERSLVEEISRAKKEPDWMRRHRLRALEAFEKLPMPNWLYGVDEIDLEEIAYYVRPKAELAESWEDLPDWAKEAYQKLGLPQTEAMFLAGFTAVYDSEAILARSKEELQRKGVIMVPMEEAVRKYPDLVKQYFGRVFPYADHKFAALHHALWSGGAFVYVPPGVKVVQPIEAFFFIGSELEGQFEHTLVVADENSSIHFIEGCAAPIMKRYSFHDGMVELYAHRGARLYFSTIQNWSRNIINFNNKRGIAEEGAHIEWLEGSIGSKATFTYPATILKGRGATTRNISVSLAHGPVIKDVGAKAIHAAPETKSYIISKAISGAGGLSTYRGLVRVNRGAYRSLSHVQCDSLVLDEKSRAYTYPRNEIEEPAAEVSHEASVGKLGESQLFYLSSRGLTEGEAKALITIGFIQDVLKDLPLEVVSVLSKVIELEFSELGAVG